MKKLLLIIILFIGCKKEEIIVDNTETYTIEWSGKDMTFNMNNIEYYVSPTTISKSKTFKIKIHGTSDGAYTIKVFKGKVCVETLAGSWNYEYTID